MNKNIRQFWRMFFVFPGRCKLACKRPGKTKDKTVCKTVACFYSQNGAFEDHREVILALPMDIADNPEPSCRSQISEQIK